MQSSLPVSTYMLMTEQVHLHISEKMQFKAIFDSVQHSYYDYYSVYISCFHMQVMSPVV